ncbi:MAG: flavin reductase family protein [Chlorobi bacterium]|nr:MAG: flavin reductase family protein [Bacteroidota bacterium]MBE2265537.1 flavin reductase family protein [Flavobacteriales bacterium]MBL1160705.1 flavin reductase family protein [Chlorobiota bacterium]MBW7853056.1 flavin reductase family protein [Candidatus Kapabacteria bacterium]MCC6331455.1 flavin reductase family protein [Ignavibacteria bacterium]
MRTILPDEMQHRDRHQLLIAGVSPRPIALVSTVDSHGIGNLAPYSFFNAFSSKPPIVAIGPATAVKTGREKDTWRNITDTGECTISTVTSAMVHRVNLASAPYPDTVDEFEKSGLTKQKSRIVQPPFAGESPFAMECVLVESIALKRDLGGNGNLMLLEVVAFHVADSVWENGTISPAKMDLVGRMGLSWYTGTRDIFTAIQPSHLPMGMDALPEDVRTSMVLTGNDLAQLAYLPEIPKADPDFIQSVQSLNADSVEIELKCENPKGALAAFIRLGNTNDVISRHRIAKAFIASNLVYEAWQVILYG